MGLFFNALIFCTVFNCYGDTNFSRRNRRFPIHPGGHWRQRVMQNHPRRIEKVCYDTVGCFIVPNARSPLTKVPESPDAINTKFYLFRRNIEFSKPEILYYQDNGLSIRQSKFNPQDTVKIIIHGYMGRWNDKGGLESANSYLKIYDCNVILVDWEKGARGQQYATAAANTEIVGRQLGILLLHMIDKGLKPQNIHLLGFSLGAHVAGCASEPLKARGHLIGRITGLDAASPLFRHNHFREKSRKLDKEDAAFVDAIHTDASPVFTDGFGLLEPIGHVDFFPNGGFEQPGCVDGTASVVKSHLEGSLTRDMACSHLRAWKLFMESLKQKADSTNKCQFVAYKCKNGLNSFQKGQCFPYINKVGDPLALDSNYRTDLGRLGEDVKGEGVMYLATRDSEPYCGTQLQTSIMISPKTATRKGDVYMHLEHDNSTTNFLIHCDTSKGREMSGLAATSYETFNLDSNSLSANIIYIQGDNPTSNRTESADILMDRITVKDIFGNSWNYCGGETQMNNLGPMKIKLSKKEC